VSVGAVVGSTPALVNPALAVSTPTSNTMLAMALERELAGSDTNHNRAPAKAAITSRSVHGNVSFTHSFILDEAA